MWCQHASMYHNIHSTLKQNINTTILLVTKGSAGRHYNLPFKKIINNKKQKQNTSITGRSARGRHNLPFKKNHK